MFEDIFRTTDTWNDGILNMGLVSGTVRENYNKDEPGKVKVEYYLGEQGKITTGWVPVMTPYAADNAGVYMLPETGTEVVIGFLGGRPDCPVVLGVLWSKDVNRPDNAVTEKNTAKVIRTKGGCEISFSDEDKKQKITVTTPGKLTLSMEDEGNAVTLKDGDGKNQVVIDGKKGEIDLKADKKISITVGSTKVVLESSKLTLGSASVDVSGDQSVKLKGQSTNVQGTQVEVKADAEMSVKCSGITQVKGSLVKIN